MNELATLLDAVKRAAASDVAAILDRHPELINQKDHEGATALHYAAFHGHRDVVRTLVRAGADINARDGKFGATPAGWAIEYLRELGGFLGIELADFAFAIERGDTAWVGRLLARFPAFRHAVDAQGRAFTQLAAQSGNAEIIRVFQLSESSRD